MSQRFMIKIFSCRARHETLRGLFPVIFDERQESLLEAVLVLETAGFGELFGAAAGSAMAAEHQIFRRVGEVDELDDVDVIALVLQDRCADGVHGCARRDAEKAVSSSRTAARMASVRSAEKRS